MLSKSTPAIGLPNNIANSTVVVLNIYKMFYSMLQLLSLKIVATLYLVLHKLSTTKNSRMKHKDGTASALSFSHSTENVNILKKLIGKQKVSIFISKFDRIMN